MTPEGRVKAAIKKLLDKYKPSLYYHMIVPSGYGSPSLDFVGWFQGRPFAIEAKARGKSATSRQEGTIGDMRVAGARVFLIDGDCSDLGLWLESVENGDAL